MTEERKGDALRRGGGHDIVVATLDDVGQVDITPRGFVGREEGDAEREDEVGSVPGLGEGVEIVLGEVEGEEVAVIEKGNKDEGSKGVRVKDVKEGSREGGIGGGGKGRIENYF